MIFRFPGGALGRPGLADVLFVEAKRSVSKKVSVSSRRNGRQDLTVAVDVLPGAGWGVPGGVGKGKPFPFGSGIWDLGFWIWGSGKNRLKTPQSVLKGPGLADYNIMQFPTLYYNINIIIF